MSFCRVTARRQIVDRELQDPRPQQLERRRQDDADEPEEELRGGSEGRKEEDDGTRGPSS